MSLRSFLTVVLCTFASSLILVPGARAADTTPPTCSIAHTYIENKGSGNFKFTFDVRASDDAGIREWDNVKKVGGLEYRAQVQGGPLSAWTPWPYDPGQPVYFLVHCTFFHFEVRAVDSAG